MQALLNANPSKSAETKRKLAEDCNRKSKLSIAI